MYLKSTSNYILILLTVFVFRCQSSTPSSTGTSSVASTATASHRAVPDWRWRQEEHLTRIPGLGFTATISLVWAFSSLTIGERTTTLEHIQRKWAVWLRSKRTNNRPKCTRLKFVVIKDLISTQHGKGRCGFWNRKQGQLLPDSESVLTPRLQLLQHCSEIRSSKIS